MKKAWMRPLRGTAGLLAIGLTLEAAFRICGAIDFPIYETDTSIGYIPKTNQSGSFLRKNEWYFNELNMGAGQFTPGPWVDTLLIGDSVVLGGNPITQEDRLGAALQRAAGGRVWPISAGSWAIRNELTYLRTHRAVIAKIDRIVFIINSGDLHDRKSQWTCDANHPRKKPTVALWYLLEKYFLHLKECAPPLDAAEHQSVIWRQEFEAFMRWPETLGKPIYVVVHLAVNELSAPSTQASAEATIMKPLKDYKNLRFIIPSHSKKWGQHLYRDAIHLNTDGNRVLANIIQAHLNTHPLNFKYAANYPTTRFIAR